MADVSPQPEQSLAHFGLKAFRPGQREVINTVFAGQDCLVVMPTGGGKSLCYQLPAVAREGLVLVVSPLIALMLDQVEQLTNLGLRATFVNSAIDSHEQGLRLEQMAQGEYDLVYVAAERFRSPRFLEAVGQANLQLLAIDEAHCISEWGHDFRPDYARLGQHRARLGNPPTIALTATATAGVRQDIINQLKLHEPAVFVTGFARPNLHLAAAQQRSRRGKDRAMLDFLRGVKPPGIIYTATRKTCEETAQLLASETRLKTVHYHGGMQTDDRAAAQDEFMSGRADVVVATTAFGMGIDKANVRFVLHYHLPGSLEAYYQEAGRAGRDGQDSHCLLLHAPRDAEIQEFFIESAYPDPEVVGQVWEFLRRQEADPVELTQQEIKDRLNLSIGAEGIRACEQLLERGGVLERLESNQNLGMVRIESSLPGIVEYLPKQATVRRKVLQVIEKIIGNERGEFVSFSPRQVANALGLDFVSLTRHLRELSELDAFEYVPPFRGRAIRVLQPEVAFRELNLDFATLEKRKRQEYAKLERMQAYATTSGCRQCDILDYFGQKDGEPCGSCDNCETSPGIVRAQARGERPREAALDSDDQRLTTLAARIALAGIARTHGRFGRNVVVQMLCGSTAAKMAKFQLNRLSTYGRLSFLRQDQVADLLDDLLTVGLAQQVDVGKYRPVVKLTDVGTAVMRGDRPLPAKLRLAAETMELLRHNRCRLPETEPTRAEMSPAARTANENPSAGPSYDDEEAPFDEESASQASGKETSESPRRRIDLPADSTIVPERAVPESATQESYYWTWRLLKAGFTPFECTQIRGLDLDVVRVHVLRAATAGLAVDLNWLLSAEKISAMERIIGDDAPQRIRPLLSRFPRGTRYEDVQLYIACRSTQTNGNDAE